ncbi:hypothetical protein JD844_011143 [Phrynosoma platyrhinos]|uniref:Ankyrin repeat and fibronectin type-III domain-containing protein 1 n=1 Tax=Phrynosoma platyrhinos TaxID=52577 RepID=A0ABQ7TIB6_PHRPL|nr:hypothetical protein JD844_011143 [Phrynosoma platyrhinos]
MNDTLSYHQRSQQRLAPGLYFGYLKLCSSVDQIKVLVLQKLPNILCHVKIRDNSNVSKEEWEWIQKLSGSESTENMDHFAECPTQLFFELQMAMKALLKQINLPLQQAKLFRLYTQEVLELGHNVSFLLLLPPSDDVCTAPGQNNPYTPHSGFLNLPLQMFELVLFALQILPTSSLAGFLLVSLLRVPHLTHLLLCFVVSAVHFCSYKEKFISLYCRLSAVIELDFLSTQQSLREAISDSEVAAAKQRHQQVLDYIQQIDEIWREMRWINEALQYARYRQPVGGLQITKIVDLSEEPVQKKISSTSSHLDCLPSPPPSPETETHRRKVVSDSQPYSDEEGCSEVFLPTDSDYDSSDALSPRELDLVYSSSQDISHQAVSCLSGSAPDVLQVHDIKPCLTPKPKGGSTLETDVEQSTEYIQSLSIGRLSPKSTEKNPGLRQPLSFLVKKKHGKHQHYSYFSRHHRWLRVHSESQSVSLSEGMYTQHLTRAMEFSQEPTSGEQISISIDCPRNTFLPHASSLPEEGKGKYEELRPSIHRIYVEPLKSTLSSEEGKSWALSTQPIRHEDLHSPTGQRKVSENQSDSNITEVFSSDL